MQRSNNVTSHHLCSKVVMSGSKRNQTVKQKPKFTIQLYTWMILNPDNKIKLVTLLPFYCCSLYLRGKVSASPLNLAQLQWRSNLCYRMQGCGLNLGLDSGLVSGIIMVINEPGCSCGVRCRTSHTRGDKRDEARLPRRKLSQVSHGAVLSQTLSK